MATDLITTFPRELNLCCHCERRQSELKEPLKRCARCALVVYCSKECQRSAWPSHKILCTPGQVSDSEAQGHRELGYESSLELMRAFSRWQNAHFFSLTVMANCAVHQEGGVEHNLNSPRAWLISLKSRRPELQDDNPATAFRVEYAMIVDAHSDPFVRDSWDRMAAERNRQKALVAKEWPEPHFAGCMPTITIIGALFGYSPIFSNYLIFHHIRPEDDASRTIPIFKDIGTMCSLSILFGYIFNPSREADQAEPYVEQNVRTRNGWKPRPADEKCWDLLCANPRSSPVYETDLSARALWTRLRELSCVCWRNEEHEALLRGE